MRSQNTRHGKHNPDAVLLGRCVFPEEKALAKVTANEMGITVADLISEGIRILAKMRGIIGEDGKVAKKYEQEINRTRSRIVLNRDSRRKAIASKDFKTTVV